MTRLAAIDIGTHSALLLIATVHNQALVPLLDEAQSTQLGSGLQQTGLISPEALDRLLAVLMRYQAILGEYAVDQVVVFATAAFRVAGNADACRQRIQDELGWPVQVLSGAEEATYTFLGALQTREWQSYSPTSTSSESKSSECEQRAIAIDIGGGSTEVILGHRHQCDYSHSFPMGAVVLQEAFQIQDPIPLSKQVAIDKHLDTLFAPIPIPNPLCPVFVTGGTATTVAALWLELSIYDIHAIEGCVLTRTELSTLYDELARLSTSQRADLPGMEPGRAGVILPAIRIVLALLRRLGADSFTVTVRGARYGILSALDEG